MKVICNKANSKHCKKLHEDKDFYCNHSYPQVQQHICKDAGGFYCLDNKKYIKVDCIKNELIPKEQIKLLEKLNPYPESTFIEPTKEEYELMNKALKACGLTSDKFFGSFGRLVWNNCINTLQDIIEEKE